ncbi:MAG: MFS transporter [Terriglobus roseus]|nr:MFS transporter [Terriglobus roseus]
MIDEKGQDGIKGNTGSEERQSDDTVEVEPHSLEKGPAAQHEEEFPVYKWVIVGALFVQSMALWGVNTSLYALSLCGAVACSPRPLRGTILSFYNANDYFNGASPYAYAFIGGLSIGCAFLIAPLSNWLTSRFGFKPFMWPGIVLIVIGQCCAGLEAEIWLPILTQGIFFGLGMGLVYIPSIPLVSQYHSGTRALANGIVSAGSGLGALIWSLETRAAIESIGLKYSFVVNGLICLILLVPSTALLRSRTKALNAKFEPLRLSLFCNAGFSCIAVYAVFVGAFTAKRQPAHAEARPQSSRTSSVSTPWQPMPLKVWGSRSQVLRPYRPCSPAARC